MSLYKHKSIIILFASVLSLAACKTPALAPSPIVKATPSDYGSEGDTTTSASVNWKTFFTDPYLQTLIDTALKNNQELNITLQEIEIAKNDIRVRQGLLLPRVELGGGIGIDKVGRYTSTGAGDASTEIKPGKPVPEWLPDYRIGATASWEVDIWKKLRNSKQAAVDRYLSTVEGRNFVITNLIAEIANGYYELLGYDNQLEIVKQTIKLQQNALEVVKIQKQAAAATELAVKKFEAEVLNSQSLEYDLLQKIKAKENELNYLLGRYPQPIARSSGLLNTQPMTVSAGIPSQLLSNRPDIKQAELELAASRLDIKAARAEFYPQFNIVGGVGFQAFNPTYLVKFPESLIFNLAGDLAGPLINKAAIKAEYLNANARQIQAVYNYERTILNAYIEVSTSMSNLDNYNRMYVLKSKQVETLSTAISIADDLFKNARADYLEVLLNQRDALEARLELVENRLKQFNATVDIYRALGGGAN